MNPNHPTSKFKSKAGLQRVLQALVYSVDGLKAAFVHEAAFRQELFLAAGLLVVAVVLPVSLLHTALLIGAVLLVLITELLNSALETIVDRVSLDRHELSKRAKDIGSAAVFLSLVNCLVIWALTLADAYL